MKKSLILVFFLAVTISLSAQHVTPITLKLTEFKLEELRSQYEGNAYLIELDRLDKLLKEDSKVLKDAEGQLKDEKDYYKQMCSFVDKSESSIKNLQSLTQKEYDEFNNLKDNVDKQLRALSSTAQINPETRTKTSESLQEQRRGVDSLINVTTQRLTQLANHMVQIRQMRTGLMVFHSELTNKETDLKQLGITLKNRREIIKAETRTAKSKK